jgi:hypothetical protein
MHSGIWQSLTRSRRLIPGGLGDRHPHASARTGRTESFLPLTTATSASRWIGSPYRSGRSPHWVKVKDPKAPAIRRELIGVAKELKCREPGWLTITDSAPFRRARRIVRERPPLKVIQKSKRTFWTRSGVGRLWRAITSSPTSLTTTGHHRTYCRRCERDTKKTYARPPLPAASPMPRDGKKMRWPRGPLRSTGRTGTR